MRSIQGLLVGLIGGVLMLPSAVLGDTFTVITNVDEDTTPPPVGSLREAISLSNVGPARDDIIDFNLTIATSTITMDAGFDPIEDNLVIDGSGLLDITLVGQGSLLPRNDDITVMSGTTTIREIDLVDVWANVLTGQTLILDSGADSMSWGASDALPRTGNLDGGGTLTKQGTGTLNAFFELPDEDFGPLFFGTLNIEEGTLRTDTLSFGNAAAIDNSGTLILVEEGEMDTDINELASLITGAGSLIKEGGASLALTNPGNSFSGGIVIQGGRVGGDTTTLGSGGIRFDPQGGEPVELEIDQLLADGTLLGGITGDGLVRKRLGNTIVTLAGSNDYSGATIIEAGGFIIENASLPGDIDLSANTRIAFDQSTDGFASGSITGDATTTFEKLGSANLALSGNNTGFFGMSTVSAGGLILGGDFNTSQIDVLSGASLIGDGRIAGNANISGLIDPGALDSDEDPGNDPTGTLTIGGDATLSSSAVMAALVRETGGSDKLVVEQTATIDGARLDLTVGDGTYETPVEFIIVEAANPIEGEGFTGLTDDLAFLDVGLVEGAPDNTVTIEVVANDNAFSSFAETPNQLAVGEVLDDVRFDAEGDMQNVIDAFNTLVVSEVPDALDALAGEQLTSFSTPRLAAQRRITGAIDSRVRGFASGSPATRPASMMRPRISMPSGASPMASLAVLAGNAPAFSTSPQAGESGFGGWLDGYGVLGSIDGDNPKDVDYDIFGASGGVDYRMGERFLVGGAFGYAYVDIDPNGLKGTQEIDTYQGALYAAWSGERFHFGASTSFGYSDMESRRPIVFGELSRKAKADFDGWSGGVHAEAGYDVFALWGIEIQPLGTFDYLHLEQDSFTEKNAGAASLKMKSEEIDSAVSGVGVRLHSNLGGSRGTQYTPSLHARWVHEFGDTTRRAKLNMTGAGDAGNFKVKGADVGRDALSAGVGYTVSLDGGLHIYAGYEILWNPEILEHGFGGGIQFAW